jgi:hypothetical protein
LMQRSEARTELRRYSAAWHNVTKRSAANERWEDQAKISQRTVTTTLHTGI